ncbi:MAG TPA: hypothetical protein VGZ05_00555 [Steroidobacteraceae bacterium]|jgi:hypothetical protein|nr:hypothetical protein [Steroidobacteraceae bacterium]
MLPANAICAITALFIVGMVWLRTRMHYARGARGWRSLSTAGTLYFAALAVLLATGWFAAPQVARWVGSPAPITPTLARVIWFLAAYYLFIPVHLVLKARGRAVFTPAGLPKEGWRSP